MSMQSEQIKIKLIKPVVLKRWIKFLTKYWCNLNVNYQTMKIEIMHSVQNTSTDKTNEWAVIFCNKHYSWYACAVANLSLLEAFHSLIENQKHDYIHTSHFNRHCFGENNPRGRHCLIKTSDVKRVWLEHCKQANGPSSSRRLRLGLGLESRTRDKWREIKQEIIVLQT